MATTKDKKRAGGPAEREDALDPAAHRRVLTFLNKAAIPEDLMSERPADLPEMDMDHEGDAELEEGERPTPILGRELAERVLEFRDREYPLGFRHIKEFERLEVIHDEILERLLTHFSHLFYGAWSVFPQPIPHRGPGTYTGVVHAALLHRWGPLFHSFRCTAGAA